MLRLLAVALATCGMYGGGGIRDCLPAFAARLFAGEAAEAQPRATRTQRPTPTPTVGPSPTATQISPKELRVEEKRAALAEEIAAVSATLKTLAATDTSEFKATLDHRLEVLERIRLVLGQQAAALQTGQTLAGSKPQVELEIVQNQQADLAKPSFLVLDKLRDDLAAEEGREKTVEERVKGRESAVADARKSFQEAERASKAAREALDGSSDEAARILLSEKWNAAEAETRAASETLRLREYELDGERAERDLFRLRLSGLRARVNQLEEAALFTQQDLEEALATIRRREFDLNTRKAAAELERVDSEAIFSRARERLEASGGADPALKEEVEARRRERALRQREVAILGERLQRLSDQREVWRRRKVTVNEETVPEELGAWEKTSRETLEQLTFAHGRQASVIADLRRDLRALEERIASAKEGSPAPDPAVVRWLEAQQRHLTALVRLEEDNLQSIEETRRLNEKLIAEISRDVADWSPREWFKQIRKVLAWGWNFPLIESQGVTVGKILTAAILFVFGFFVSRRLTRSFEERVLKRSRLAKGAASALRSITYYVLLALSSVIALKVANVPLTLFTFVGGALAIGFGFGSQHVINNFISGLILLIERPIQEGDLIDLSGTMASVVRIGPRCTHVRTASNVDIFVPNSSLLQNNVINWTASDSTVRTQIAVSVAYGSATREVAKVLRKVADEHGKVLKKPEPLVLLTNFGDNGLDFVLQFWIQQSADTNRLVVESDLRFMIDKYFREAGIEIPFPHRDLRMRSGEPLDVRLLREQETAEKDAD